MYRYLLWRYLGLHETNLLLLAHPVNGYVFTARIIRPHGTIVPERPYFLQQFSFLIFSTRDFRGSSADFIEIF